MATGQRGDPLFSNIFPFEKSSVPSKPPWWFLVVSTPPGTSRFISKYSRPELGVLHNLNEFSLVFTTPATKVQIYKNPGGLLQLCGIKRTTINKLTGLVQLGESFSRQCKLVLSWTNLPRHT